MALFWAVRLRLAVLLCRFGFEEYASREVGRWFRWQGYQRSAVRLILRRAGYDA